MPKIQNHTGLSNIKDTGEFVTRGSQAIQEIGDTVNGKLEFDKNLNTQTVSVNFTTANTDVAVSHNLNKVGVNFIQANSSVACNVFKGKKVSTSNTLYLQSTQPATVTLILY